jgi:hypothetical protein
VREHVNLLLRFKVDVNVEGILNALGPNLTDACLVEDIVKAGLDLRKYSAKVLETAACVAYHNAIPLFVENGAPTNGYGRRATVFQMVAAYTNSLDMMEYLVDRGADCGKPAYVVREFTAL